MKTQLFKSFWFAKAITIAGSLASIAAIFIAQQPAWVYMLFVLLILSLIGAVAFFSVYSFHKRALRFFPPADNLNKGVQTTFYELKLTSEDGRDLEFGITESFRVLAHSLEYKDYPFVWTGAGIPELSAIPSEVRIEQLPKSEKEQAKARLHFSKPPLLLGDFTTIYLKVETHDPNRSYKPIVSKLVKAPLDILVLRVSFSSPGLVSARFMVFDENQSEKVSDDIQVENGHFSCEQRISNPLVGYKYMIAWEYDK